MPGASAGRSTKPKFESHLGCQHIETAGKKQQNLKSVPIN
jgi:hypothetical protein